MPGVRKLIFNAHYHIVSAYSPKELVSIAQVYIDINAFMKVEGSLHQQEHPEEYGNVYRYCKAISEGKELVLKVPRTRSGMFYPSLLAIIRAEDEERRKLIFSLYSKGLTTKQAGSVFEDVYGKDYSKQPISYLMKESKGHVHIWLSRGLKSHYLVVHFDATFVHTRRDECAGKEGYYTLLGIKEDGSREVLSIVNHPTVGALLWEEEMRELKRRGVEVVAVCFGCSGRVSKMPLNVFIQTVDISSVSST